MFLSLLRSFLRTIFSKLARMSHRKAHQIFGFKMPQAPLQAIRFAKFCHAIGPAGWRRYQGWH